MASAQPSEALQYLQEELQQIKAMYAGAKDQLRRFPAPGPQSGPRFRRALHIETEFLRCGRSALLEINRFILDGSGRPK